MLSIWWSMASSAYQETLYNGMDSSGRSGKNGIRTMVEVRCCIQKPPADRYSEGNCSFLLARALRDRQNTFGNLKISRGEECAIERINMG